MTQCFVRTHPNRQAGQDHSGPPGAAGSNPCARCAGTHKNSNVNVCARACLPTPQPDAFLSSRTWAGSRSCCSGSLFGPQRQWRHCRVSVGNFVCVHGRGSRAERQRESNLRRQQCDRWGHEPHVCELLGCSMLYALVGLISVGYS